MDKPMLIDIDHILILKARSNESIKNFKDDSSLVVKHDDSLLSLEEESESWRDSATLEIERSVSLTLQASRQSSLPAWSLMEVELLDFWETSRRSFNNLVDSKIFAFWKKIDIRHDSVDLAFKFLDTISSCF